MATGDEDIGLAALAHGVLVENSRLRFIARVLLDRIDTIVVRACMDEFETFFDPLSGRGLELLPDEREELACLIANRVKQTLMLETN